MGIVNEGISQDEECSASFSRTVPSASRDRVFESSKEEMYTKKVRA